MKRFLFLLLLVGCTAGILSAWISSLWEGQEDAYITYSYAKHLAQGKGFIASAGSNPSLGTTSPLFTMLLVPFAYLGVPPHIASMWIGVFCHALIAILLVSLARKFMNIWLALATGAFWAFSLSIFFRLGGMETPVEILLMVSLALFETRSQASSVSAVILALLLLCRPDSLLIFGLILAFWIFNSKTRPNIIRNFLIIAVILLPWIVFALQTFGTMIPSSLVSKFSVHISGIMNLNSFLIEYFPFLILLPPILVICILGFISIWGERYEFRPFLVWIPFYYFSFLVGHAPDFAWYYVPPLIFIPLIFIRGLLMLTQRIPTTFKTASRWICVLIAMAIWVYANWICTEGLRASAVSEDVHKKLALFLREYANEQDLIATTESGMLSYYSERRVLDMLGLTTPEVLRWSVKQDFIGIIRHYNPRFVMIAGLDPSPLGYRDIKRLPYMGMYYHIYEKNQAVSKDNPN